MSDLRSQGIRALIWDFSGKLGSHGLAFLASVFLARLLEPSDFGLLAIVTVYIGIASIFTDAGLAGALVQREEVEERHYSSVFYFNFVAGIALTLLAYFSASAFGAFYENSALIPIVQILSVCFVLNALGTVQAVRLRKELNYQALSKAGFLATLASSLLGVGLAFLGFGVYSLVVQSLTMSAIHTLILWYFCRWIPSAGFSHSALGQLWVYGFRMFLVALLNAVSNRLDLLLIGKMFPPSTLGYFELAKRCTNLVNQYSSGSLMSVMFPVLSKIQSDSEVFNSTVLKTLNILSPLVFLFIGLLYLSSEQLVVFVFSEKWSPSIVYLELLLLGAFAFPLNALLVNVLSSKGNSRAFLRMAVQKKSVFFSNFLVFLWWGIEAYLVGLIVVGLINTVITMTYSAKEMRLTFGTLAKPVFSQLAIFVFSLGIALAVSGYAASVLSPSFLLDNLMFSLLFIGLNTLLMTQSWRVLWSQISQSL